MIEAVIAFQWKMTLWLLRLFRAIYFIQATTAIHSRSGI